MSWPTSPPTEPAHATLGASPKSTCIWLHALEYTVRFERTSFCPIKWIYLLPLKISKYQYISIALKLFVVSMLTFDFHWKTYTSNIKILMYMIMSCFLFIPFLLYQYCHPVRIYISKYGKPWLTTTSSWVKPIACLHRTGPRRTLRTTIIMMTMTLHRHHIQK